MSEVVSIKSQIAIAGILDPANVVTDEVLGQQLFFNIHERAHKMPCTERAMASHWHHSPALEEP
jgi:uncharacterized ParB-like nuclease family protein